MPRTALGGNIETYEEQLLHQACCKFHVEQSDRFRSYDTSYQIEIIWAILGILECVTKHHCRRSHWWHASNLSQSLGTHPNPETFQPTSFFLSAIFFNALVTPPGTAPIWNVLLSHLCFSPNLLPACSRVALWKHLLKAWVAPSSTSSFVENTLRHKEPSPGGCIAWLDCENRLALNMSKPLKRSQIDM